MDLILLVTLSIMLVLLIIVLIILSKTVIGLSSGINAIESKLFSVKADCDSQRQAYSIKMAEIYRKLPKAER